MNMQQLNKDTYADAIKEGLVLVDFYAEWCGPCKMLGPILDNVEDEVDDLIVCKVDLDRQPEISNDLNITSLPTMVIYKDGVKVETIQGVKSIDAIKRILEEVVSGERVA